VIQALPLFLTFLPHLIINSPSFKRRFNKHSSSSIDVKSRLAIYSFAEARLIQLSYSLDYIPGEILNEDSAFLFQFFSGTLLSYEN
jgi:hypothetical protein